MNRRRPCTTCLVVLCLTLFWPRHAQADPPDRLSIGGIEESVTSIEIDGDRHIRSVAPVGDVDGDGLDDLLLRIRPAAWNRNLDGEDLIVLLYGAPVGPGPLDLLGPDVPKTLLRTGLTLRATSGGLVGGEDVDGDGTPDFMVTSALEAESGAKAVLLILGDADGGRLPEEIDTARIGAEIRGTIIFDGAVESPDDPMGDLIALSPDINGDGHGEIIIAQSGPTLDRRKCFVLFGSAELPPRIDLSDIGAVLPGLVIEDSAPARTRGFRQITPLGDVDGDGLGDLGLVLASRLNDPPNGHFDETIVLFGRDLFPEVLVLGDLPTGFGVRLPRYVDVARGGDIDGDGVGDVILFHEIDPLANGKAYILYGRPRVSLPDVIDRDTLVAQDLGAVITERTCLFDCNGVGTNNPALSLARGRDLDGDGKAEMLFGASGRSLDYDDAALIRAGAALFLPGDALPDHLGTDEIPEGLGTLIDGIESLEQLGTEVFLLEDFDGDGTGELVLTSMPRLCSGGGGNRKVWIVPRSALERTTPHVGRVQPGHGPVEGGHSAVIFGTGFDDETRVRFGEREAELEEVLGSGILLVRVPPGAAAGEVAVRVTTSRGDSESTVGYLYVEVVNERLFVDENEMTFRHFDTRRVLTRGVATGDFNGDSFADVALSDTHLDFGAEQKIHIAFGAGRRDGERELDFFAPPEGVTIDLVSVAPALASGGDINGDGFDDLLVRDSGRVDWRALLGRAEFPLDSILTELPGTVLFSGTDLDTGAAAIVPDVSGDGIDDLLVASRDCLYIVKGRESFPAEVVLDGIAESGEGAIYENRGVSSAATVAGPAGDFNGDGVPDVFFAWRGRSTLGAVAILYGGADMFPGSRARLEKSLLGDSGGLLVTGRFRDADPNTFRASVPGDLDGDGASELFLNQADYNSCTFYPYAGKGFVLDRETILRVGFSEEESPSIANVYASESIGLPDFALGEGPPGSQRGVLTVTSNERGETLGAGASPAGDFNGDGYADLLIGSTGTHAYVIFGGPNLFDEPLLDLSSPGARGMTLDGEGLPPMARVVEGGFDWDRDGVDDILLATEDGRVDIVFGDRAFGNAAGTTFLRGDADGNGGINLSDGVFILEYLFSGARPAACLDALDVNDDGGVGITDAIAVLGFLFAGGPAPPPPHPEEGPDPTADDLFCGG